MSEHSGCCCRAMYKCNIDAVVPALTSSRALPWQADTTSVLVTPSR